MSLSQLQVAIYARVSSEQQAVANTIESLLVDLQQRVKADGFSLSKELQFIDEGYTGATLVRPALERLRDLAAVGGLDRLYVHSPDRLARKYAYQVFLVDELQRTGVEVVFLNRELGRSPEDDLLLQVQGMMAEYERAKILERSRRRLAGMLLILVQSIPFLVLHMATVTLTNTRQGARLAMRFTWSRLLSCVRSLSG